MIELLWCLVLVAAVAGWWRLSSTREQALTAAKVHCQQMGVQFLDGSVMSNGYQLTRDKRDNVALLQKYRFEFTTTGDQRYSGYAELIGKRVVKMELEPHRLD
ncbi:MAG: DUF3301 domain-containing protein [Pseudomonadales bacterium]|nr:DUF3301 domain-containing protein [Pseudomonadales bacterium]